MLVNGKWVAEWQPVQAKDEKGGFVRQTSSFRNWITLDGGAGPTGEGGFDAERGLTPYEAICKAWADEPDRFRYDPIHLTSKLNT